MRDRPVVGPFYIDKVLLILLKGRTYHTRLPRRKQNG